MSKRKIVAGNWKMNTSIKEGIALVKEIKLINSTAEILVFPPATHLYALTKEFKNNKMVLGAQNFYPKEKGAFTGEISPMVLKECGVENLLIGHSERRSLFNESDLMLKQKLEFALEHGFDVTFCIGENLEDRKSGKHKEVVIQQLLSGLDQTFDSSKIIIAYEPVWAIGTGETASPEQAQEMHHEIRKELEIIWPHNNIPILYGGSVKPGNAKELFSQNDVDGGLIGGASLNAKSFEAICHSF